MSARLAVAVELAAVVALAPAGADAPAQRRLAPRGPGALHYESRPARDRQLPMFGDPRRQSVLRALHEEGARRGVRVVPDARLDAAMDDLARSLREGETPHGDAVEFVLGHHGVVEPYPRLRLARGGASDANALRAALVADSALAAAPGDVVAVGVGVDRATSVVTVIAAMQTKSVDLDPLPRTLPAGGSARVTGALLGDLARPRLYVTRPDGDVHQVEVETPATPPAPAPASRGSGASSPKLAGDPGAARFAATFACDAGDGRYQVEIMGSDRRGPRVLANFPIHCGVAPPRERPGPSGYTRATLDAREAETRLLALVNRDRRRAGLPPVAADEALAAVARAHCHDMRDNGFVGHISPTTGDPLERARRAGLDLRRLSENVGQAGSVEEIQQGLMRSPAHRGAMLDARATHAGIGVVLSVPPAGGAASLIATQLFR